MHVGVLGSCIIKVLVEVNIYRPKPKESTSTTLHKSDGNGTGSINKTPKFELFAFAQSIKEKSYVATN